MALKNREIVEFGPFRLIPTERAFLRDGSAVNVTPKVFDLLCFLASNPGKLHRREDLMQIIWPDSFVEESNLTVSIAMLRKALGEHGDLIQTVPKQGYRFAAEIRRSIETEDGEDDAKPNQPLPETPAARPRHLLILLASAIAVVGAGLGVLIVGRGPGPEPVLPVVPLTTDPLLEQDASISPDGTRVAYTKQGVESAIYVQQIPNGEALRVSPAGDSAAKPAWSPDGAQIAYVSSGSGTPGIVIIPSLGGGIPRRLLDFAHAQYGFAYRGQSIGWSANGKWILFPDGNGAGATYIGAISLETGERRTLTTPPAGIVGDYHPALSPDGGTLVFSRNRTTVVGDYYAMKVTTDLRPASDPARITSLAGISSGVAWNPGSRDIVFSSGAITATTLYRSTVSPSLTATEPERVNFPSEGATGPAISAASSAVPARLVFESYLEDDNIRRISMDALPPPGQLGALWAASTRIEWTPAISPDGSKVALASTRSGSWEIWVCRDTGTDCTQLTHIGKSFSRSPSWSPDGNLIVFDSRSGGQSDLYVINVGGGVVRRLTNTEFNETFPSWSHDGRYIYFTSNAEGENNLWRMPATGGPAGQLTQEGQVAIPKESPDGRWLYFRRNKKPGIARMALPHGPSEEVSPGQWDSFALREGHLFLADRKHVVRLDVDTNRMKTLVESRDAIIDVNGLDVSPDGRWLLFITRDQVASDLFLVDHFH